MKYLSLWALRVTIGHMVSPSPGAERSEPCRLSCRLHVGVAVGALILALLWWWPLPVRLATHVPGSETWAFDEYTFVWNLWWFRAALLQGMNPLRTDWLFHPLGMDLVLYTYNAGNALLAFPLLDLLPLVVVSNLVLLFTTVLSAWGTWLLARWVLHDMGCRGPWRERAALLAGLIYAFGAYRSVYAALGHYDMVSTGFIPLFALFWLKSLRCRGGRAPVMAGFFMAAALYNEMIFGVFLAMLAGLLWLFTWRQWAAGWWYRVGVAVMVAALLWAPLGWPVVRAFLDSDFALQGWGDAVKLSADVWSFVTPTSLHPLLGGEWVDELRAVREGTARFQDVNTVVVGRGALALALLAAILWRRRAVAWLVGVITFAIFSLGPLLQVNGRLEYNFDGLRTGIPLPFILLHYVPIVRANRVPNRFSVVLMLCVAVLVALAAYWLLQATASRAGPRASGGLSVVLAVGLLFEHVVAPLPLTDARVPAAYAPIIADPDDVAVLTLPLGWRHSFGVLGAENTRVEYYQTAHGKRLISGNISRAPRQTFDYFARLPVFRSLITLQTDVNARLAEEEVAEDRASATALAQLLGIRYLVIHPPVPGRPPYSDTYSTARAYALSLWETELAASVQGVEVYRLQLPPLPDVWEIDVGRGRSEMYLGPGWASPEIIAGADAAWAIGPSSTLLLPPLPEGVRGATLTLRVAPFEYPGAPPQRLELLVNGQPLVADTTLRPGWQTYTVAVPRDVLNPTVTNRVILRWAWNARPRDVLPHVRQVGRTGVALLADVEVTSGGPQAGDLAYITVNGQDASYHRRGVNVTVLEPLTGRVEAKIGFDTAANEFEAQKLAEFIAAVPAGRVVVVAFRGDALAYLTPEARRALAELGAAQVPEVRGASYALIGVKGAPAGTAVESVNTEGPAYVRHSPDDRPLAAAVDWVRWEVAAP
ncbi:MAG: interleukin-like EMT inducer domain-containing protein [Ardenticatenia bacterium]|nr:interleukin-like EMT inducer domain-containing protein [Ardenticatenia bacterium]